MFIDYGPFHLRSYLTDMALAAESITWAGLLTSVFRFAVRRPRPYLYIDGAYPDRRDTADATMSFWSGHVADLFAIGVTVAWTFTLRHGVRAASTWIVWTVLIGTASSVAVMRVLSGEHFPSDVLVGATAGTGVGLLIPYVHPRRKSTLTKVLSSVRPIVSSNFGGLAITGSL